ncbi:DNA helicase [Gordonia phage Dorito]|uniref:DnaB-like dsDNA helicase n=2 Tax=Beenievirus TaxID=3044673 RepID=A0A5P8DB09_9CAUD|nr:DNA helicase [Gordonia phage Dorito]YP_010654387.1 DnaB-like dsDNA helicase [Gordonia phage DobbysSock]AZS07333.1 DNA helicase [Gordonia phage Dorito]QFP96186.1 DnaB-like dsDNA helicase [Gordonia phage DobbysSock]
MNYESDADEQILIAAMLSLTNTDDEILDRIAPEVFSGIRAQIWETARQLRAENKATTPRNIQARHPNDGTLRNALTAAAGHTWPVARVREAERTVVELDRFRRLQGALQAGLERMAAAEHYSDALEAAHAELNRLAESTPPASVRNFADVWDTWWDQLNTPTTRAAAIPTPWHQLNDKLAGGMHRGRTYVVGGRPGEGKSIAGVNMATYAAEHGHQAIVFSVEMGEHEVASRIIASGAQAEYGQITRRQVDDHNLVKIAEWGDQNRSMPLRIVDRADIGVEFVSAVCRSVKRAHGLDVVFVDYLQLLKPSGSKIPRQQQIADMSRALKVLAMDLQCAVIIACQLNRNSANEKRAPVLADLRESGAIEQDCDVAILLNHKRTDDGDHTGDVELIVAKNRTGSLGAITCRWSAYQARIA